MTAKRTVWLVWTVRAQRLPAAVVRAAVWSRKEAERQGRTSVLAHLSGGYTVTEVPLLEGGEVA